MNEFSDLESDLKQLRPAAPAPELISRVERALAAAPVSTTPSAGVLPRPRKITFNWFTVGLGVAAAAALFLLARPNVENAPVKQSPIAAFATPSVDPTTTQPVRGMVPDGMTRVVYNRRDEGLLFPRNSDQPVRRKRAHSRETLHWRDRQTGASLRVSYPTEEVELIPVSGQ